MVVVRVFGAVAAIACLLFGGTAKAASASLVYAFQGGADGAYANSVTSVNGVLYGTTQSGGDDGHGTVFSLTVGGVKTTLYSFKGGKNGTTPDTGLVLLGNKLYGATNDGGATDCGIPTGCGTIFSVTLDGRQKVEHIFTGAGVGSNNPVESLIAANGMIYGISFFDGTNNGGSVFSLTADGVFTTLHAFSGSPDGRLPVGELVYLNGVFYGTTASGGSHNAGAIFSMTADGAETVIYSFLKGGHANDHAHFPDSLTNFENRLLFGTTIFPNQGSVFRASTDGREHTIYEFAGSNDVAKPSGPLTPLKGVLYGASTVLNIPGSQGGIYKISNNGVESIDYAFTTGSALNAPFGPLVLVGGAFYGSAQGGSTNCQYSCGEVYQLIP